jgi:hypothetical protein
MALTIDELSPQFVLSQEGSHATPPRSGHTGLGAFCPAVLHRVWLQAQVLLVGAKPRPEPAQ